MCWLFLSWKVERKKIPFALGKKMVRVIEVLYCYIHRHASIKSPALLTDDAYWTQLPYSSSQYHAQLVVRM